MKTIFAVIGLVVSVLFLYNSYKAYFKIESIEDSENDEDDKDKSYDILPPEEIKKRFDGLDIKGSMKDIDYAKGKLQDNIAIKQ